MDIRNWEFYDDGTALVGATVRVRDALLTHPNGGTVLASTTTDSNGAWAFTGLTDAAKDVEVIWGNVGQHHRWYKGFTRHNTGTIFFEEAIEFKQVASLGTAAGVGSSILGFKTDGEPIFRSGAAGAETKIATYTGATGVLKAGGWGTIGSAEITDGSVTLADLHTNTPRDLLQQEHDTVILTSNATQAIATATYTPILFQVETLDTNSLHSTSVNTSRVTIAKNGTYIITGSVLFEPSASGLRMLELFKNGGPTHYGFRVAPTVDFFHLSLAATLNLVATDYLELQVYQTTGGSLNIGTAYNSQFGVTRMRPA